MTKCKHDESIITFKGKAYFQITTLAMKATKKRRSDVDASKSHVNYIRYIYVYPDRYRCHINTFPIMI